MLKSMLRLTTLALSFCTLSMGLARAGDVTLKLGTLTGAPVYLSLNGGSYSYQQGGNVGNSLLDGKVTPYIYCVDLNHSINTNFNGIADETTNGVIHTDGTPSYPGYTVNNAGQVSWLVKNLANGATTAAEQGGLQAAIWKAIYGSNLVVDTTNDGKNSAALINAYNNDMALLGSNTLAVNKLYWLSPFDNNGHPTLQGLVALTPEPSTLVMLGTAGVGGIGLVVRRRRGGVAKPVVARRRGPVFHES